ncbi:MAG: UbiD family decarboxylase [Chitinophagales bacterium]|nr:UbiD family decarboxylase [Chitinophagales bacterium]
MSYNNLHDCLTDLEKNNQLIRIKEEVDPYLEMAAIQLRVFEMGGPAILFENIKGCEFKAVSNLFGTLERSRFMFRDTVEQVKTLIDLKGDINKAVKNPFKYISTGFAAIKGLPKKISQSNINNFEKTTIDKLPQIQCWSMDGGPFVTLPIVYSEDADKPGVMSSNLGMYRIQLGGNDYVQNAEIGLHYQLHRGIGVHQTKWNKLGKPMKVSIFIGGPPSHTFAAVMPLPEGLSELTFAGVLGGRRFRYFYDEFGFCISADADFVITGEVFPNENKPEGPFGDHLGYYSWTHDFPLMKVSNVYHKKNAIWPFTVVGRPPQEDTQFGAMIHEITGNALMQEIPGLIEVNAVDAAGVHPLLLAVGSERYTPYLESKQPQEILTIANHILGTGQLSLAKYLFIAAKEDISVSASDEYAFFQYFLSRVNWERDIHFQTKTSIDTLDYSGTGLNEGSKVVLACAGDIKRKLGSDFSKMVLNKSFIQIQLVAPGILAISGNSFIDYAIANKEIEAFCNTMLENNTSDDLNEFPLIIICDEADFLANQFNNFLWVTFTRSNPSHDIYGIDSFTQNKHFGCKGSLIIDARKKAHHAPELVKDKDIEKRIDRLFERGGSLNGILKK